jgi:hypothetical protein
MGGSSSVLTLCCGPAGAYYVLSPLRELLEDLILRLVFFLVCKQAQLVYVFPLSILACVRTA